MASTRQRLTYVFEVTYIMSTEHGTSTITHLVRGHDPDDVLDLPSAGAAKFRLVSVRKIGTVVPVADLPAKSGPTQNYALVWLGVAAVFYSIISVLLVRYLF